MSIRTVYNRDGSVYGELNTDDFVFNNDAISSTPVVLDTKIYPYVKINGVYYINDGQEWFTKGRSGDSGSMMSNNVCYVWQNDFNMFDSLSIPGKWVAAIDENKLGEKDTINNDLVDIYKDNINHNLLNQIASYHTMPRYYIGNKNKSFKGISFNYNVENYSNNPTHDGQFIFKSPVEYNGGNKEDTKYWSMYPQVYPIVVFNNMTSTDNYWSSSSSSYVLNNHTIKKTSSQLIIDGVTYTLRPSDTVICYIRNQGEYLSNCKPTISDLKIPAEKCGTTEIQIKDDLSITSTLSFSDIELYDFSDATCDTSFSASTTYKSIFTTNSPTSEELYKEIIHKYSDWTMQMPTITGADFGSTRNFFASLGTYTFNRNWFQTVVDIQFQKNLTFSNNCTIKNFSSMVGSSTVSNLWKSDDKSVDCYVYAPGTSVGAVTAKYVNTMRFQVTSTSLVGTFPKNMGFFQSNYDEKDKGSTFTSWNVYLRISGLDYSYKETFSSDSSAYTVDFKLTSGYINSLQTDTFALAIVIWRNGKLLS